VKFPSITDVAESLRVINRGLDPNDFPDGKWCDVRLQVYPDGDWTIRVGDSSYDQDHRGYWGSSSLNGRRFKSIDVARDLLEQCKEHHAQSE